jgi:excisionase family DNA binding protein
MESRIDSSRDDEDRSIDERLDKLAEDIRKLPPERLKQLEKFLRSLDKKALSLREAARMMGVSIDTVRRAVKSGKLKAFQLNEGGVYRISTEELDRFMRGEK